MRSTRDLLERAARSAPTAGFDLSDLRERRDRRQGRQRVGAAVVALALTALVAGAAVLALRDRGASNVGGTGPSGLTGQGGSAQTLPPAAIAPLVAAPGEYYYRAVYLVGACSPGDEPFSCEGIDWRLDAAFWWAEDDSGRIEVDERRNYGIDEGRFDAGAFPNVNGIDVSTFPTDPVELTGYLLARSRPDGASPAPLVTPPPQGGPEDGRMWRAITDLLADPHVTPTVRAALLDVAAALPGSEVRTDVVDPVGRPAHVIEFGNWGGHLIERLFVDPTTHELLGWSKIEASSDTPLEYLVIRSAGLAASTGTAPDEAAASVPSPRRDLPSVAG